MYEALKNIERKNVDKKVNIFVSDYTKILERDIMGNKVDALCEQFYRDHAQALELIFDKRPDTISQNADLFAEWCDKQLQDSKIIFDKNRCDKYHTRFRTQYMKNLGFVKQIV